MASWNYIPRRGVPPPLFLWKIRGNDILQFSAVTADMEKIPLMVETIIWKGFWWRQSGELGKEKHISYFMLPNFIMNRRYATKFPYLNLSKNAITEISDNWNWSDGCQICFLKLPANKAAWWTEVLKLHTMLGNKPKWLCYPFKRMKTNELQVNNVFPFILWLGNDC